MPSGPFVRVLRELAGEGTIARGHSYHRQQRVGPVRLSADEMLEAVVTGTRPYDVRLGLKDDGVRGECTCPAWKFEGVCKHVVALAFFADEDELSNAMLRAFLEDAPVRDLLPEGRFPEENGADAGPDAPGHVAGDGPLPGPGPTAPPSVEGDTVATYGATHWRSRLAGLERGANRRRADPTEGDSRTAALFELWIEPADCRTQSGLVLTLTRRPQLKGGRFGEAREASWGGLDSYRSMPDAVRAALGRLEQFAGREAAPWGWRQRAQLFIPPIEAALALEAVAGVVSVRSRDGEGEWGEPLRWSTEAWCFGLVLKSSTVDGAPTAVLEAELTRRDRTRPLTDARVLLPGGIAIFDDEATPLDDAGAFEWVTTLRDGGPIEVSGDEVAPFLAQLIDVSLGVPLDLGDLPEPAGAPQGILDLTLTRDGQAEAAAVFQYGDSRVPATQPSQHVVGRGTPLRILRRDGDAEASLLEMLQAFGVERDGPDWGHRPYRLPVADLADRCGRLIESGWQIEVESKPLRSGGALAMRVSSGVDWFDIQGEATFDQGALPLPDILHAVREGRGFVTLDDGGAALLPPEWTERLESLGALAGPVIDEDMLRVSVARAPLLDLLLAEFTDVKTDATFKALRRTLHKFSTIAPRQEPKSFHGELREYQREALGWFAFLRQAGLGGCLADDMGLGKTVQVLACLLPRRRAKDRRGPSLVVAPRSVLSNWINEAKRFAPSLRTAMYHGQGRRAVLADREQLDVIVTTYGTMRSDIEDLTQIAFDYVVLDESQAIKNAASKTARAARLLDARYRLALSGTPIENHVDELGSLFAFLNPGLLGGKREFQELLGPARTHSPERLAWLQSALRPVILRRTREQVLTELPEKEEQVVRCPLRDTQRSDYDSIREHYRASVLSKVDTTGLSSSKMHVLEALLRLRQAACHPGLIDPSRSAESAAKLDQLLPMLEEISDAGHKALVFSQFTSFLSIVRSRLDNVGIRYEYLDGRTKKRGECVERFQNRQDTAVFLISLKAGGTGLNLTAAQYVFLLDPWWNPAVEAQAIGRAHRMGQTNPVSVYRLIGEDTVEDRVLELQERKRELVQAVLGGVNDAMLRDITRGDLERLLG